MKPKPMNCPKKFNYTFSKIQKLMEIQKRMKFEKWIKIQKLDQIKYLAPLCTFRSYVLYSTSTTLTFWGHFMKVRTTLLYQCHENP